MPEIFSLNNKTVFVAGHNGLVGSALMRRLAQEKCAVLTVDKSDLDLRDQADVQTWMKTNKPDVVIMAAATVGGIGANMAAPAEFIRDNIMIEANLIHAAHQCDTEKLLFLGSSCIYPKDAQNPITEDALLTGALEATNAPYAIAKIAGIQMCQSYRAQYGRDFIAAMPCNLYGPNDTFDADKSHVIPALILKAHQAKTKNLDTLEIWGSGMPLREFLYSDDLADALVFCLKNYSDDAPINIGSGHEISIQNLSRVIADIVGFKGNIIFNTDKPNGTPRKLICSQKINDMGWHSNTAFLDGITKTYDWFLGCC